MHCHGLSAFRHRTCLVWTSWHFELCRCCSSGPLQVLRGANKQPVRLMTSFQLDQVSNLGSAALGWISTLASPKLPTQTPNPHFLDPRPYRIKTTRLTGFGAGFFPSHPFPRNIFLGEPSGRTITRRNSQLLVDPLCRLEVSGGARFETNFAGHSGAAVQPHQRVSTRSAPRILQYRSHARAWSSDYRRGDPGSVSEPLSVGIGWAKHWLKRRISDCLEICCGRHARARCDVCTDFPHEILLFPIGFSYL